MSVPMVWRRRAWRARATAWIQRRLRERDFAIAGQIEQIHVVDWSTVLRVPTDRGIVYFKATWPPQRYEAAVTSALARWRPADVGVVLAADPRRGWLLIDDAGTKLREILAKRRDLAHWKRVLPRYAELQLATTRRVAEVLRLGVPDRRSAVLAERYERLLDERVLLRIGLPEGLSRAKLRRLRGLVPIVREWCDELGEAIPDTIQHDDLHDGQIFVRDGAYRILDWGDAVVSHPFYSMTVGLRSVAYTFELKEDSPVLRRLRDIYLEPFTIIATPRQIRESYAIARRLGRICRALTWASVVPRLGARKRREERGGVPGWLALFLEAAE
jgi:hypothetical protein